MKLRDFVFGSVLEDDEYIVDAFRRLLIILVSELIGVFVLMGGIIWGMFLYLGENWMWFALPVFLFGAYKSLVMFNKWYLNAVLMTNQNIIILEWKKFFHKRSIVISYWNLDEPKVEQKGVLAFIRNYGDVTFLKLNSGDSYVYRKMAHPHKVLRKIHNHKEQALHEKNFQEESTLKNLISQMVQTHVRANGVPSNASDIPFETPKRKPGKHIAFSSEDIEYEKQLDDFGGIEIDLEEDR